MTFMDLLIETHLGSVQADGTHSFTLADVCEEVDTFMFEGYETTAAATCWTLHLLGSHLEIQKKAYEEVFSIFGDNTENEIDVHELKKLKYVECCIKEALRLYPSAPVISRKTTEEIDICGHKIPSGLTIAFWIYGLQRDPKYFPNANEFIPERFAAENQEGLRNPFAYIPFSAGPRNCIGQRFALQEVKTIVTNVLRNFRLRSLVPTKDIPVSVHIMTKTAVKLDVCFEKRH